MSPEERERKRLWMVAYNKRIKSTLVDTLNVMYGTNFSLGQHITYAGRKYIINGIHGHLLIIKNDRLETLAHPLDVYPAIKLSGTVTFDGWTMGPNGKLKIKKG